MNSTSFRMPARRLATVATATALAAGPVALTGVSPAHATGDHGRASAVVLRTGLDVSLLNKSVDAPLAVSLNEVQAPQSAEKTALTARLDGVNGGQPFSVLRAEAAEARATATAAKAEGSTTLARARVHVPGLPLLSVIEIEQVTAKAVCEAGKKPVATTDLPGSVTVLGKRVTLTAAWPDARRGAGRGRRTPGPLEDADDDPDGRCHRPRTQGVRQPVEAERGRGERHAHPGRGDLRDTEGRARRTATGRAVRRPRRGRAAGRTGRGGPGRDGRQLDDPVRHGRARSPCSP